MALSGYLRRVWLALKPRAIDELLYSAPAGRSGEAQPPSLPLEVRRFDSQTQSGIPAIDRRLARTRVCYAGFADGALVHQSWLSSSTRLPGMFGFDRRAPVIGDCWTRESFRGKRLYPYVLRQILEDVGDRGFASDVYILVAPENLPSIRGIERAGFTRVARLRGIRIGLWIWRLR